MSTFGATGKSTASKQTDAAKAKTTDKIEDAGASNTATEDQKRQDALADQKDLPVNEDEQKSEEEQLEVDPENPHQPTVTLDETKSEEKDREAASIELGVGDVTDPETQADSAYFEEVSALKVPGAAAGPDVAGVVRNNEGNVAFAPAGTLNAAMNGVQQDASGHVDSIHTTPHSTRSGVRV